jgi:aldehyde:ferredoxin oxidoreductase
MKDNMFIYRIDIKNKKISKEEIKSTYRLLGGRSLTSRILLDELDPSCEPLGPKNKLVLAPGLLGGTSAPCSGRLSIGGKSPLTEGIKESNSGGTAAIKLAKLGIKAIIIEDRPENNEWYSIKIGFDKIEIITEKEVIGAGNYKTAKYYQDKYGNKIAIISIGPAGENQYQAASISITDMEGLPTRHCARGGLGALMGSKKLKAILIDDSGAPGVKIKDNIKFKQIAKEWIKTLISTKKVLTEYGTANLIEPMNALGCIPTNNFSDGSFKGASLINANKLQEIIKQRGGKQGIPCHPGCVIKCSKKFNDLNGNYLTTGMEYETLALMGANCGIDDLDTIAQMNRFCDDIGLDTMEMGVTLGIIMESGLISFGDGKEALKLLQQTRQKTILGRLIAQGAALTGKVLGVRRIPVVKNQGIPGYDPRGLKGTGVTYITSSQGADHTAGNCLPGRIGFRPETNKILEVQKPEGQGDLSLDLQIMTAVCDFAGLCFFVGPTKENMEITAELINAKYGTELDINSIIEMGKEVLRIEREFNKKAGFTSIDDQLPEFFYNEKLPPKNLEFDIPQEEIDKALDF